MKRTVLLAAVLSVASASQAQKTAAQILAEPAVQAAMKSIEANEPKFIEQQIRLTEIPAPPFHETAKGLELKKLFEAEGLANVRIDAIGNVLGDLPGAQAHPHLVIAAHQDTVFPAGTDVHVTRQGNVLKAPGISDDGRGLAAILALMDTMVKNHIKPTGTLTFVADVGEEGLGDTRGTKELFNTTLKGQIDDFISVDGTDPVRVVSIGVGSYRYRVTFTGPGGHSFGAFGLANPAHALGRAVAKIADIEVPTTPKTTYNVGVLGGGTSVNAIPFEAWFEFDERSSDTKSLDVVDAKFKAAVQAGLNEENAFRHDKGKLSVEIKTLGIRPAGLTPADSPILKAAAASSLALGLGETKFSDSSTDANVPMHLGIPAMTMGGGGVGTGAHSLGEAFDTTGSYKGVENLLLTALVILQ